MKITTVSYVKLFPLGMYINEKIGVEVSLEAGEDAMLALDTARNLVHEYHEKNNPIPFAGVTAIADNPTIPNVQVDKEPEPKLTKEEKQKKLITDTKCIDGFDGLDSYKLLVKNNDHLKPVFDDHMKYLLNGKYRILDKNGSEMPDHYSGEPRTYEQAKKMLEGLNNNGEFKPYRMEIINQ